ncbi:MAG: ABC transporter ATP-binding protein [Phascolarctobacterium sp.]|nr:ABC transporter ATP-binding protein [Phascolarctobacterium sp.]
MKSLKVKHLSFGYTKEQKILDDISIEVESGEILGILGPNGTGKTTLIKCVNNILEPSAGKVFYGYDLISQLSRKEIAKIIAYVPQYNNSFFGMNVVDAVLMGRMPYVTTHYTEQDKKIAFDIIKQMELEKFAFRSIKAMSGGERQRVFIARSLVQQPKFIILDEPTSALDLHNQLFILHTLANIAKEQNIGLIMTIHDLNLAAMFCDKILMLKDSHVFAYGTPHEVLTEENIDGMYRVNTKVQDIDGFKHVRLLKNL